MNMSSHMSVDDIAKLEASLLAEQARADRNFARAKTPETRKRNMLRGRAAQVARRSLTNSHNGGHPKPKGVRAQKAMERIENVLRSKPSKRRGGLTRAQRRVRGRVSQPKSKKGNGKPSKQDRKAAAKRGRR